MSKNKNTDDAKSELRNLCYAVLAVPLTIQSNLSGKAVPRLLSETTGLSPSRLRMNSRANLRASTIRRSRKSGEEMTRNHLKNIGYSESEILTILHDIPSIKSGETRYLADQVYWLQHWSCVPLPDSIDYAIAVDRLIVQAIECLDRRSGGALKKAILSYDWGDNAEIERALQGATTWKALVPVVTKIIQFVLMSLVANIDAEYGCQLLGKLKPGPLLPLVTPTMYPGFSLDDLTNLPKRNLVLHP